MLDYPGIAWVNGKFSSLQEAQIPFLDRGYFFGDGVYEAVKVCEGKLFALKEHLERFERSMKEIRITPPKTTEEFAALVLESVEKAGIPNAMVYLQVTRGVGPRIHAFLPEGEPMVTIFVAPMASVEEKVRETGVSCITVPDERWAHPHIKTLNLLPNVLAKQAAAEQGAYEAILVLGTEPGGGLITEASSSNVAAVIGGKVVTPPLNGRILPGVSRAIMLDTAREAGIEVEEREITLEELRSAEEIMLTNTGCEVLGVGKLDGVTVGKGGVGPITRRLYEIFMAGWEKRLT
ncbi:MAG TPA: D-amino acid aminotransferase [Desulfitobacterium dehalogenans]|uniref:D-amino acid aminotransferase n=1 Tax=Desulfitobacterium dehalogenans TaxID=36854 RepID=A0A7C7DAQ9_9FIRM|nr:D-amino acid aminotransferase [Desulfitobacterium dehalogenans]